MARRRIRSGLAAGAVSLALIATACGDSKSDSSSTTDAKTNEALATTDCGKLEYDASAPTGGEYVDYAYMADSGTNTSFDPGVVQTLNESQITTALFDGLTDFDFTEKCKPELKGNVAEKWEMNADATEATFTLKKGEVFSDGSPVLPSSFKKGWERAGSKELGSPYGYLISYIKGGDKLQDGSATNLDEGVVADDANLTLKVTLASPNADFPSIVSHPFFSPVDAADLAKIGNKTGWGTAGLTIGNGPFKLEKADDTEVVLVPNDKWAGNVYGDKKVHLSKLTFKMSKDVESAYQTFEAGQGDSAPIPSGKYKSAEAAYPKNTVSDPNMGSYYFDFGFDDAQLGGDKNVDLRKAISLSINREELNNKVYEGTRQIATGVVPPGIPGFKAGLAKYAKYDPDEAKKLFKTWTDAGGKLTKPVKINYNEGGSHGDVAAIVQANLKDTLGIDVELAPVAEDYFKVVAQEGGCQICRSGWYADYPTYGNFMVDLFSKASIGGNNFGRYDNPEFEKVIKEAQGEVDATKRGELYNKAEDILLNQSVDAIPLVYYTGGQVFKDSVLNYDQPPLGIMLWERIALEK
jgi:ABC-type oligopeptide transport system substrate-binding subunit